jgi:hypothetical protein
MMNNGAMIALFTLTVLVGAAMLFLVQPMFARMVLPLLGGSPAVWNTALVFYQSALLAGYAYTHFATTRLGVRRQALLHLALVIAAFWWLPIALPAGASPPTEHSPVLWLLGLLAARIGLPFFVVSATGPLMQKWFAATRHRSARDPYFLYAASNLGSMAGLLSYPVLLEPHLRLADQSRLWGVGFGLLASLTLGCAIVLYRFRGGSGGAAPAGPLPLGADVRRVIAVTPVRRLRWVALAFVPSSLMLGVTTHITTDVAAIPLLWVAPLAVYLLSFILVFASRPPLPHRLMTRLLPPAAILLLIVMEIRVTEPLLTILGLHLVVLFLAAMVCHGELARDRPPAEFLTEFYLWLAVGGALGGVFNALVAPVVFRSVVEYPVAIALACAMLPAKGRIARGTLPRVLDVAVPAGLAAFVLLVAAALRAGGTPLTPPVTFLLLLALAIPLLLTTGRPLRFGLAMGALFLASAMALAGRSQLLYQERSFFGVHRVRLAGAGRFHELVHGTTLHGVQSVAPLLCSEPLSYYHRGGSLGAVFAALAPRGAGRSVAVAGLGAGALAAYAEPGERWTFFEIDPAVARIASDPRFFCYLSACPVRPRIVLGDARRSLAATGERFDLMILDAYSSDAIPVHLLTREALRLYLDRLAPHGVLVFHLTNRHFDLVPVVARLASDEGLTCRVQRSDRAADFRLRQEGKASATAAVLARTPEDLGPLAADPAWAAPEVPTNARPWTDDFSSLLSVLRR